MSTATSERMPRQMWAFLASATALLGTLASVILGSWRSSVVFVALALAGAVAARVWSRQAPAPMPHWMRWVLYLPRTFHSPQRLRDILDPRPGQRVLEVGPGVGIHALPVADALGPSGRLDVLDVQSAMLDDLMARARKAGLQNIHPATGDAARLPYADCTFDGAYLISVLGEVSDEGAALRELHRVLKPGARLVVGEIVADPDFISVGALRRRLRSAGFEPERRLGPGFAYLASFVVSTASTGDTAVSRSRA